MKKMFRVWRINFFLKKKERKEEEMKRVSDTDLGVRKRHLCKQSKF